MIDLAELVDQLRAAGGDTAEVEVKSAAGGLPESITPTLSALANLPGGGAIILGLDERHGFAAVGLPDPQTLKQGIGSRARAFEPPVRLTISDGVVDGQAVVIAEVHECDAAAKPCRVASTGRAYLRSYDGDYELSALEQQAFLAARSAPHADRAPVAGSSTADLDPDLVAAWLESLRNRGTTGLGRFAADQGQALLRGGVVTSSGEVSVAGLLTLGLYPQQFFPRFVVQVAADTSPSGLPGARARNVETIDGPIPVMLERTLDWLRANIGSTVVGDDQGRVRDVPDFPLGALRELVANALVHRDLAAWSEGQAVELRLTGTKFAISNPGGLFGITVDRLAREHVTSARNAALVALCQDARLGASGVRVIEALASGLPRVAAELAEAHLPPARFFDAGIRFTVLLEPASAARTQHSASAAAQVDESDPQLASLRPGTNQARVLAALRAAPPLTIKELAERTGTPGPSIRRALTQLRERGLVHAAGGRGQTTTYRPAIEGTTVSGVEDVSP